MAVAGRLPGKSAAEPGIEIARVKCIAGAAGVYWGEG
jgi:hypothetical protein